MHERRYRSGDTIFRAGEPADVAYIVREGAVRCDLGQTKDGRVSDEAATGAIFGEAGVLTGGRRTFSATAMGEVALITLDRGEILTHLEDDRLRLRALLKAIAADWDGAPAIERASPPDENTDETDEDDSAEAADVETIDVDESPPETDETWEDRPRVIVESKDRHLTKIMGAKPLEIESLPFVIGREPDGLEPFKVELADLVIADTPPYRLSRLHFAIEARAKSIIVRDCGSYYGTIVNGKRIGGRRHVSAVKLGRKRNEIIAGGKTSPFRFTITLHGDLKG